MKKFVILPILFIFTSIFSLSCQQEQPGNENSKSDPLNIENLQKNENVQPRVPMAEYTKETPAEWVDVVDEHIPQVKYVPGSSTGNVQVSVEKHPNSMNHYIEKIGIMDRDKRTIVVKELKRGNQISTASLTLKLDPKERKDLKVFVKCNMHDLWTVKLHEAINEKHF
ncbi:MAG: desulfoferrodoxin family protein [Spirochaetota bacterium]